MSFVNFPEGYRLAANKLYENVQNASTKEEAWNYFENFLDKFTGVPDILKYWENAQTELRDQEKFRAIGFEHLYHESEFYNTADLQMIPKAISAYRKHFYRYALTRKITKAELEMNKLFQDIVFLPHQDIPPFKWPFNLTIWEFYNRNSTKIIPRDAKDRYEAGGKLLQRIQQSLNDNKKWLPCIKETNDKEFILQNIECRIGRNPLNKDMWNLYFSYLNEINDYEKILDLFRRYCRLFVDDKEKQKQYHNEIKKFQKIGKNVVKWILDTVQFEIDFHTKEDGFALFKDFWNINLKSVDFENTFNELRQKNVKKHQNFTNIQSLNLTSVDRYYINDNLPKLDTSYLLQNYSLPSNIFYYITQNANHFVLQKLQKTSKHLTFKLGIILCQDFSVFDSGDTLFFQDSLFINTKLSPLKFQLFKNIYLINTLRICTTLKPLYLSTITSKIFQSTIKNFEAKSQNLTMNELKILISSGKVENFLFLKGSIKLASGEFVHLEDILMLLPELNNFCFGSPFQWTSKTSLILSKLKGKPTIKHFEVYYLPVTFDPEAFAVYARTFAVSGAYISLNFPLSIDENIYQNAKNIINVEWNSWPPANNKPLAFKIEKEGI